MRAMVDSKFVRRVFLSRLLPVFNTGAAITFIYEVTRLVQHKKENVTLDSMKQYIDRALHTLHALYQSFIAVVLFAFIRRSFWLTRDNLDTFMLLERTAEERDMLRFRPPNLAQLEAVV